MTFFTTVAAVFSVIWITGILLNFKLNQRSIMYTHELHGFVHVAGVVGTLYLLFG